ncbi:MAG: asparagine synthase (glutamine-hydrolyzing), partial [Verrucomicrobiales bacterium]|nr:asparagine synthase (glutamine-hydrolyzing) [Verrucomicrobiales bacterium]
MCGIAAILAYDPGAPPVEEGELVRMRECMSARGPDGAGLWTDPRRRVGLAHRRLAIIDLSPLGAQPMHVPERALAIVFNGEIYNYRELRAGLESRGHRFVSTSDTEVLLRLYAEHGEAMLPMLRGMFAFALWDGQKRGLLLARDPFGIKPLYVADDGKTLRAASQVKALLAGGQVSRRPDPAGHVGFFLWGHVPEPHTLFQGIRSLPAGTTLWCEEAGRRREQTFCSIPDVLREATGRVGHELPDWAEALRDSVRQHLVADVPVGVFLSSGVDSATVTTLASEQGGDLRTVTLGFEEFRGTPNDETPLAERLARELGTKHQTVRVTRRDFEAHVERLFDAMDQPSINGVNTYFVSFAAAQASLKVALSGLGGDELFGGYPSFRKIPQAVRTLRWFDVATVQRVGRLFRLVMAPVLKHVTSPKYAGLLEYGGRSSSAYLLHRCLFMPWELPNLLDADMVRAGWRELEPLARLEMTVAGLASAHARVSALELCWYMRNQLLRDSDWASMAHSVEIRVPYVDVPLLRALAPRLVGLAPPTKRDLAGVPSRPLPSEILNRPKTGFQIPVREWLMAGRTTGQWDNKT